MDVASEADQCVEEASQTMQSAKPSARLGKKKKLEEIILE